MWTRFDRRNRFGTWTGLRTWIGCGTVVGFETTAGAVSAALLLAHQGGWDEMLLVAGPIGVVVFLIRLARKRAEAIESERNGLPADLSHGDPSTGARDADAGRP